MSATSLSISLAEALEYDADAVGREYSTTSTPSQPESISATSATGTFSSYLAMNHLSIPSLAVRSSKRPHCGNRRSKLTEPTFISILSTSSLPEPETPAFVVGLSVCFIFTMISPRMAASDEKTTTGPLSSDPGLTLSFSLILPHPAAAVSIAAITKNLFFIICF